MPFRDAIARTLARRYRIERELGRGGFAVVFLAHDLRHDRPVALKVLHEEIAATLGAERFEREIKLAARLQHPHIMSVFDSGEAAGRLWFTMPYVEGESLRDRLSRERQLPVSDAVLIAREVADALEYAHRHGVLHRDIKPENILLSGRHAMVADFGIARALSSESGLTQTAISIGTPGYMSPEQSMGDRQLDARSDIYALGAMLYEMIAGEAPFTGPNPQAVIARALTEAPRSLTTVRSGVSDALSTAVLKSLSKVPADRHESAAAFATALETATAPVAATAATTQPTAAQARWRSTPIFAVFALGIVIGLGGLFAWRKTHDITDSHTLAVLPFESVGGSDDAYFADGITDEVRGKLSAIPGLRVTARASANQYRANKKSPAEIGAELGVAYLLTGTVRWANDANGRRTVRVTPELIDVSSGSTKWQKGFDGELRDVFATQTNIAAQVAQELDVQMNAGTQERIATRPTQNLDAYDEYLRGQQQTDGLGNRDPKVLVNALAHYQKAVALDSNFTNAWVAVATIRASLFANKPSPEAQAEALRAVQQVQRIAPQSSEAHRVTAVYRRNVQKEFRAAYDELALALRADPNNSDLLTSMASSETQLGLFDSAFVHVERARRIDPKSIGTMRQEGATLGFLGRYPEAVAAYDRLLAIAPTNLDAVQAKVRLFVLQDDMPAAKRFIAEALTRIDSTTLAIRFAYYQEMMWVLDAPLLRKLVALQPLDFYKDPGMGALKIGRTLLLLGDTARGRVWGDSALRYLQPQVSAYPDDAQLTEIRGRANALAGHKAEAVADAERSLALRETSLDATSGPYYRFQVARILVQAGQNDRALNLLEPLLTTRATDVTPGSLRLDPTFAPLRGNPRFDRIVARR